MRGTILGVPSGFLSNFGKTQSPMVEKIIIQMAITWDIRIYGKDHFLPGGSWGYLPWGGREGIRVSSMLPFRDVTPPSHGTPRSQLLKHQMPPSGTPTPWLSSCPCSWSPRALRSAPSTMAGAAPSRRTQKRGTKTLQMDEAMEKIGQLGWKKMQKNIEQTRYNMVSLWDLFCFIRGI